MTGSRSATHPERHNLKSRMLRATTWTLGGYGGQQTLRVVSNLLLAWLLVPDVFGLMAMIIVVQQGLKMFSDIGIGPSIIQNRRGMDPAFLNTAWTIQIIRGVALWLIASVLAWPVAALYAQNDPQAWQLVYLLPVAALTSVIAGFKSPAMHTLNRKLALGRLTVLGLVGKLITIAVAVPWAMVHPTAWAIIAGTLTASVFKLIVSHRLDPDVRVRMQWDRESLGELISFGKWIFASTAFTFLATHLDKLILGGLLSMRELGLYFIALIFAKVALKVVGRLSNKVLFPALAKFQEEPVKLVRKCLEARQLSLLAGGAVCVGFALIAPWFFGLLYREDYASAGLIAQWLSVYVWCAVLLQTIDRVPLAMGYSRPVFMLNVLRTLGVGVAVGGYWLAGLPGFILGMAAGPLVAQAYVVWWIPTQRGLVVRQSLWATLLFGAYGVPAVVAMRTLNDALTMPAALGLTALLALVPAAVAGGYILSVVRDQMRLVKEAGPMEAAVT